MIDSFVLSTGQTVWIRQYRVDLPPKKASQVDQTSHGGVHHGSEPLRKVIHEKQEGEVSARGYNGCDGLDGVQDRVIKTRCGEPPERVRVAISSNDIHGEGVEATEEVHRRAAISSNLLHQQVDLDIISGRV